MPQYFKLRKKARAGARFAIKQIGWNARKDDELLRWIRRDGLDLAVLSNVYLLSPVAARAFHRGLIPGIVVTDDLLALVERQAESPDNGRAFFVDLAAKHVALARGLGFDGVYLGGNMPAATFGEILELAGSFGPDDWRGFARELDFPLENEFYFFERDPETGLSSDEVSTTYLDSKKRRRTDLPVPLSYRVQPARPRRRLRGGRAVYPAPGGRSTQRSTALRSQCAGPCTRSSRPRRSRSSHARTAATARCPRSPTSAPSRSARRTSATGRAGARATVSARSTTRECIWSQAYERLKTYGEEESMLDGPIVVKDNALAGTSAWANTFLGRDHQALEKPGSGSATE